MFSYFSESLDLILGDFLLPVLFVFGVIVGSFLNVCIYRLHTNRRITGSSHCLSCGTRLSWYELFPLLSYLVLRGQCRHCGARIPPRYFFVELLTALLFVLVGATFADPVLLVLNLVVFALIVVVLVYDVRHTIIPDEMTIALTVLALVMVSYDGVGVVGSGVTGGFSLPPLSALAGGAFASVFYGALWYVSSGRWIGLGDAKLAFPLGLLVSFPLAFSMVVWSFWIGALFSLLVLGIERFGARKPGGKTFLRFPLPHLTMKSEIPFAPFLIVAFVLTYIYHFDILVQTEWLLGLLGL